MEVLSDEHIGSSDSEGSDSEGCADYSWLADNATSSRRKSARDLLDNMAQAEITDICLKLDDSEIVCILKEMHNQAHICSTPGQLLTQVRYLLSNALTQITINSLEQCSIGVGQSPPRRTYSMSKMVAAGFKALRPRKNTPTTQSDEQIDIEARQTTV